MRWRRTGAAIPRAARTAAHTRRSAKFADPGAGDITRFGTASAWAAIAPDDEDEEEEEAAAAAATPAGASAVAPSAAAAVAAASGATGIALRAEELLPGTGDALDTDDAVKEKCSAIATALRLTTDAEEALRCVCELRCVPVGRRERIVDVLLQAGLDAEKMGERVAVRASARGWASFLLPADALPLSPAAQVRKVLAGLVPRRALTPAMLANGVAAVLEFYDDILVDYPRAADYFEDMLAGLIEGTVRGEGRLAPALSCLLPPHHPTHRSCPPARSSLRAAAPRPPAPRTRAPSSPPPCCRTPSRRSSGCRTSRRRPHPHPRLRLQPSPPRWQQRRRLQPRRRRLPPLQRQPQRRPRPLPQRPPPPPPPPRTSSTTCLRRRRRRARRRRPRRGTRRAAEGS